MEPYHPIHEVDKTPKRNSVILHHSVDWCEKVAHALYVAKILVEFVVRQKHVLHLFHVDIRPNVCKRGVWIGVRYVLSGKNWYRPVCPVHILLYMADPKEWGMLVKQNHA